MKANVLIPSALMRNIQIVPNPKTNLNSILKLSPKENPKENLKENPNLIPMKTLPSSARTRL